VGRLLPVLICLPLLAAASAPVRPPGVPIDTEIRRAQAEQASAEADVARLRNAAGKARTEAERLRVEQGAAARAIEAAEARITAADMQLRLLSATAAMNRQRLQQQQQPLAALLAGLATMARQPPLLAIADQGSADEFVRVRVLLGSTLPVIRARTAALTGELREAEQLRQVAAAARAETLGSRRELALRRKRFAALEQDAMRLAQRASGQALAAGDVALAAGETFEQLRASTPGTRSAAALAATLAQDGPSPARPFAGQAHGGGPPFGYRLPAASPVTQGLGAVSPGGVRSRGLTMATPRGVQVVVPADGTVRFSGPFRDYDGVLIIDHGGGWMSVLLNVGSRVRAGAKVRRGAAVGRALGPIGVELSRNGQRWSPAIIAGSSESLSKGSKGG
jgi:septal ring factor EnvC (AmiA/AmiB activator)